MSEKDLADSVRRRIWDLRLTKKEVAKRAGISRVTLNKVLQGQTKGPGLHTVIKLAEALQVSPIHLLKALCRGYDLPASFLAIERVLDQGSFVRDVTYPDNSNVTVNQEFEKIWEIQNNGNVVWENRWLKCMDEKPIATAPGAPDPGSMMLVPMVDRIEVPVVKPGQVIQLKVKFRAPTFPCTTMSYWKMVDQEGNLLFPNQIGVWCLVKVVSI